MFLLCLCLCSVHVQTVFTLYCTRCVCLWLSREPASMCLQCTPSRAAGRSLARQHAILSGEHCRYIDAGRLSVVQSPITSSVAHSTRAFTRSHLSSSLLVLFLFFRFALCSLPPPQRVRVHMPHSPSCTLHVAVACYATSCSTRSTRGCRSRAQSGMCCGGRKC